MTKNKLWPKYAKPVALLGALAAVGIVATYTLNDVSVKTNAPLLASQVSALVKPAAGEVKPTMLAEPIPTEPKVLTAKPVEQKSDALGCLVEPSIVVDVSSPVSGLLDKVSVERGDRVNQGQTVATLESRVERASVDLALARLKNDAEIRSAESNQDFARKKHERNETLHRDGVVSAQVREQAETESILAQERLKQTREQHAVTAQEVQLARSQLSLKTISSPITGLVVERFLSSGERADDKPILRIAQVNPLRVEAILPAAMYGKVKQGMTAKVQPELPDEVARQAQVTLVDKVIDPASNTFRVRLELPNQDYSLPSGVRCKINIAQL
jgi:membrane fusion protein, heavy metal efflux system